MVSKVNSNVKVKVRETGRYCILGETTEIVHHGRIIDCKGQDGIEEVGRGN